MGESKQNVRTFTNCWSCVNFVCQRHSIAIDENKRKKEKNYIQWKRNDTARIGDYAGFVCVQTLQHMKSPNAKWRSRHWGHDFCFVIVTLF